jgi:hypothetical protein
MDAPSSTRIVALACVVATLPFALHVLLQSLYGGVVTDLRDALQTGSFGIGIMTVAFGVPGVVLQPMAGALVDRFAVAIRVAVQ